MNPTPDQFVKDIMSASMSLSEREAGDILRRVIHLEEGMKELRSEVRGVDEKVDGILARFDRIDGGWKVLIAVGGIAGTLGGLLMAIALKVFPFLLGTLPKV